ncbi:MAG: cytochrome c oxidase subunit 3 [Burkholderiales bacterium]|jgi:cytochrome c oxidase subunit III|uniref:cytochrome c oxidase subunit 3 n=1 Tax=Rheinheimera sp. TaxID=1869214 RepID=UPI0027563FA1|nr:cytochrome c oxidase subunit 3 [Burkholderiales bacterium]
MNIIRHLTTKPWEATAELPLLQQHTNQQNKRAALKVFLGVVAVLFTLLIVAYAGRMAYEDWRPAPQIKLMWANTLVLFLGSLCLELAQYAVRRGQQKLLRRSLLAAGLCTLIFLLGQAQAWRELGALVFFQVTNPAIAFFYLITGLHGLHLLGGLVVWGQTLVRLWRGFELEKIRHSVELCTIYWHFLLLVWLVLFGLLFAGNNLDELMVICGIKGRT